MEVEKQDKDTTKEDTPVEPLEEGEVDKMKKYVRSFVWPFIRRWDPTFWRFKRWRRKSRTSNRK